MRQLEWGPAVLRDFHLTLPLPLETEPLDQVKRAGHLRWRLNALSEARREFARTKRAPLAALGAYPGPLVEVAAQDDVMGLHPYAGVFAIAAQIEPRNQLMVLRFQQT